MRKKLAAGLLFNSDGNPLLEANIKHDGFVITPIGGKVEPGETPDETVIRELRDEYRLRVRPLELIGVYPTVSKGEGKFDVHMYSCAAIGDSHRIVEEKARPVPQEPEKSAYADWYSLKDLNALSKKGLLAANMATFVEVLQDNYREFCLGDIHAEIPPTATLGGLLQWYRYEMGEAMTACRNRRCRDGYKLPMSFLLCNETPELAQSFFKLSRAMSPAQ